jgi:peptide/nickel transport system permease protein
VITYIIRRLLAAVVLLFVISAATFAIFYLIPRLAGSSPETLATRYVGRAATPETVNLIAHKLGFYDPVWLQYGRWIKGVLVGADYDYGAGVEHCPAIRSSPGSRSGRTCWNAFRSRCRWPSAPRCCGSSSG